MWPFFSQMVHEIWHEVAEESEGDSMGRKPDIGQVFLMDRGGAWGLPGQLGRGLELRAG